MTIATPPDQHPRVLVSLNQLAIPGPAGWYHSSPTLRRGFCPTCGTALFSERANAKIIGLTMGSLDDPTVFRHRSIAGCPTSRRG